MANDNVHVHGLGNISRPRARQCQWQWQWQCHGIFSSSIIVFYLTQVNTLSNNYVCTPSMKKLLEIYHIDPLRKRFYIFLCEKLQWQLTFTLGPLFLCYGYVNDYDKKPKAKPNAKINLLQHSLIGHILCNKLADTASCVRWVTTVLARFCIYLILCSATTFCNDGYYWPVENIRAIRNRGYH